MKNRAKKILLIAPPFYRLMGSHYNGIHLGLGYLTSVLRNGGYEASVYNTDYSSEGHCLDQREIYGSFDRYRRILNDRDHDIWREVRAVIREYAPDAVGIQMYTGTFKSAMIVADIARSVNPDVVIITGGTHPTLDPEGTIRSGCYDYVVRGEGEHTIFELMSETPVERIAGLTYRGRDGQVVSNADRSSINDLDSLPFPHREVLNVERGRCDVGAMITSRGCPYQCQYCASPRIWRQRTQHRGVNNVIAELEHLSAAHGATLVRFQDDTFTLLRERVTEICRGIIERDLKIEWVCDTRVDRIDEDLVMLMKAAGCVRVKIGVESGSDEILKRVYKGITTSQIRQAVKAIRKADIPITAYYMIGFPGETDDDVQKTIQLAEEIGAEYNSLSIIAPYYGTELYKRMEDDGHDFGNRKWEYFFHQSREMIMNTRISEKMVDRFFGLNDLGKHTRI